MMKKLPKIHFKEPCEKDVAKLSAWVSDWNLRLELEEAENNEDVFSEFQEISASRLPYDADIEPGDIRLLDPSCCPSDELALIGVLAEWPTEEGESHYVIAFFSAMATPAMRSEWQTARGIPLATLSLWNSRIVSRVFLEKSWKISVFEESDRQKALAVYKSWALGKSLPNNLMNEVGPPLLHPEDPRHAYVERENHRARLLDAAYRKWTEENNPHQMAFSTKNEAFLPKQLEQTDDVIEIADIVIPWTIVQLFLMRIPRAAAGDDIFSKLAVINEEQLKTTTADVSDKELESRGEGYARVVIYPTQDRANPNNGYMQWEIHPATRAKRALILDPILKCELGSAEMTTDGEAVTLKDVPWSVLEPFSMNPEKLKDLVVVVIADE